ncbi:MAG: T9SS type A sorting domain-containing protein [Bacteroidales bacterium]|nr:T9SS type A sorting domain-containing protein [Bacteroidales bacterium]
MSTTITFAYDMGFTSPDTIVGWYVNGADSSAVYPKTPGTFTFTAPSCGAYELTLTLTDSLFCDTDSATLNLYFYDDPIADAGTDGEVCGLVYEGLSGTFTGANCDAGTAPVESWAYYTGPDANPVFSSGMDSVTVTLCGTYEFIYTVVNGECTDTDTVQVKFYDTPVVDAGMDADVCGLTYTLMPGYTVDCDNGGTVATAWSMLSGPGTASFTGDDVTVSVCGTYTFSYKVTNGPCADSASVVVKFYDTPVVDAGTDDDVCGLTYVLTPAYTIDCDNGGTVTTMWSMVSGPGTASFTGNDVTVDVCGIYTFKYKVTNGPCADSAEVTISFYDTPVVDAGADDTVCGLTYDLTPNYTVNCTNGGTVGTVWTKNSGPGVVIFSGNNVSVDTCGTYTFYYTVTNGPCSEVDSVDIFFSIPPEIWTDLVPDKVCGFTSPEFLVGYTADCVTGSENATWTTNATSILPSGNTDGWIATVDTCGTYWFTYTVTNGYCTTDSTFEIEFYETPDPAIIGEDTVFTCSTVEYTVTDLGSCNPLDSLEFKWHVTGGVFAGGVLTPTGQTVSVDWDNIPGSGQLIVEVNIKGLPECGSSDTLDIYKQFPTFEGQIKYWNSFETYMPTPFSTELYSSYPFDYFYVTLYRVGLQGLDSITTVYVQPRLMEDLNELMSYFDFGTLDTWEWGCDAEYVLKVWDGGLIYHTTPPPPAEETIIGASYTYNNWGGVNATDALAIQLMVGGTNNINGAPWNYSWVGLNTDAPWYGYYSHGIADVNSSNTYTNGGITALDALTAKYRAVGLLGSYPHNGAGNNQFTPNFRVTGRMVDSLPQMTFPTPFDYDNVDDVPFTHSGTDYMYFSQATGHKYTSSMIPWGGKKNYINLYYESIGDINASYVPPGPGLKAQPTVSLTYEGLLGARIGDELTIPVSIDRDAEIGAITLSFSYRNDLIEVLGTNYTDDDMYINQEDGILNIAWFSTEAVELAADASVAQIRVRILAEMPESTELFALNANTELADATANPISDLNLKTSGVTTDKGIVGGAELTATNYPNPFNDATTISYVLPESGKVKVLVYNNVGMLVTTLVDKVQESGVQNVIFNTTGSVRPGIYFYHITVQGETNNYSAVKRMIVVN